MKPDCERFDALMTSGAPLSEADAPFVKEHAASCESCRELENALASVAFRPQDDTHFPMDDLSARRMVNAVLEQAAKEEHETEAAPRARSPVDTGRGGAVVDRWRRLVAQSLGRGSVDADAHRASRPNEDA